MATSEEVQSKFDTIVGQLADLDSSVDVVLAARTALEGQVTTLNETIAELQATATRLADEDAAEDAEFVSQITALQGVAANLQAEIDATYSGLDNVSNAISAIDAEVDGTSGEVSTGEPDGGEVPTDTPSETPSEEPVDTEAPVEAPAEEEATFPVDPATDSEQSA